MSSRTEPGSPALVGSPVLVGSIVRAHGLAGEVLVFPHSDLARRFQRGQVVFTAANERLTVGAARATEKGLLIRFEEISDRNASEALGKADLFIPAVERRPLGNDEYWPDELVGLEVRNPDGSSVGRVVAIDDTSPQARLVVAVPAGETLIPLVTELVPEIDLAQGFLVLRPIPGLLG